MLENLSADIICPEKWTVFRERGEEQIMSKDKYPSLSSPKQRLLPVFNILQTFFAKHEVLKIGEYSPVFGHVTSSDQLRWSEKIWWITTANIHLRV